MDNALESAEWFRTWIEDRERDARTQELNKRVEDVVWMAQRQVFWSVLYEWNRRMRIVDLKDGRIMISIHDGAEIQHKYIDNTMPINAEQSHELYTGLVAWFSKIKEGVSA